MPRHRPPTSGYARLSQAEEEEAAHGYIDDFDDEDPLQVPQTISSSAPQYAPIQPRPHGHLRKPSDSSSTSYQKKTASGRRRGRSNSSVDIKAINARLERWAEEIAAKFKINKFKGKSSDEEQLEIHHSVFQAPAGVRPVTAEMLHAQGLDDEGEKMSKLQFDDIVESVRTAIELGMHPKMISQGSSGSYFARNAEGKVVGVFKPKDEEPYASRNPKWTKWIHRNLFPCFFGRACLIPNLSYVSEAAAYTLDTQLRTNIVPYTDIVHLSSKAFYYDYWQRTAFYRKRKPLPMKPGSFQVFLQGFKDANVFLRDHPWPDHSTNFRPQDASRRNRRPWAEDCRPRGTGVDEGGEGASDGSRSATAEEEPPPRRFVWTEALQQSFREELEKLVILDYMMRNTDRGLDNWMVKVDWKTQEVSITAEPVYMNGDAEPHAQPIPLSTNGKNLAEPYRRHEAMTPTSRSETPSNASKTGRVPTLQLGAIDNSLSWPWKHPDAWRSFPFGWLFLPVSLIGQPFSQKTRDHFLPLLTSTDWWSETQVALRKVFEQDSDFKDRMFARQIAVMKGQAWNVVETLKTPDHGPLELTRRTRICVWDDLVDIPVAIPMRTPAGEIRQQRNPEHRTSAEEEEMDISAANSSVSKDRDDLISFESTRGPLPPPNRFEVSRNPSSSDIGQIYDGPEAQTTTHGSSFSEGKSFSNGRAARPNALRVKTRASYDGQRPVSQPRRLTSLSARLNHSFLYDGDGDEGDLGYAAAADMEGSKRKVIVERLETVQSKNPVFTWC